MFQSRFEDEVFLATVRIVVPQKDAPGSSIGTGFIWQAPLPDREGRLVFIVSNKHVFGDGKQNVQVKFHQRMENEDKPDLGKTWDIGGEGYEHLYYTHPNDDIDLACLNVTPVIHGLGSKVFFRNLDPNMACLNPVEAGVVAGGSVWFVGYPEDRFDVAHNLPLLRRGYIASLPFIDFNGKKQLVIDANVYPGSSGSPVFTSSMGKFRFIGVIAETMIKNGELLATPTGVQLGVQQVIGLGILLKAELVVELLDHAISQHIKRYPPKTTAIPPDAIAPVP